MIISLSIRNFALIDELIIDFNKGFSVVTGETGAGKSIIMGALSLILGSRADAKAIKNTNEKCVIEGIFDLSNYHLQRFFEDADIEYDEEHCILRRELSPSGKSRAFINDTPVSLQQLKTLGSSLIDIHSQHQNLLLGEDRYQLNVIDILASNHDILVDYRKEYDLYKQLQTELRLAKERMTKGQEEADYLRFQYEQLEEAALVEGQQKELEKELDLMSNVEDIKQNLFAISQILENDQSGVISGLRDASTRLNSVGSLFAGSEDLAERLYSNYVDIKEIFQEVESLQDSISYDPERHVWLQERLDLLYRLEQKHHVNTDDELIALRDQMQERLDLIDNSDEEILVLEDRLVTIREGLEEIASALTRRRKEASVRLASSLVDKLKPLGMPNVKFEVGFSKKSNFDETGIDCVQYLFSANKNQQLMPVVEIASGGEISRLMLIIKSIIASEIALPTIIFDEIDTGVSGEIADKMGDIMAQMSQCMQVITISHLPQVASKGDEHYKVYKVDTEDTTQTQIHRLSKEERVHEIARMLSGSTLTEHAISNARSLLNMKE